MVIVTASPAEAVLPAAQALGVPEGDVLAIRLETDEVGVATGQVSSMMPLTWRGGKAEALGAYGLTSRLRLAVGNSMDDVPMLRLCCAQPNGSPEPRFAPARPLSLICIRADPHLSGQGMLCVPPSTATSNEWAGAGEDSRRLAALCAEERFWLHEAMS